MGECVSICQREENFTNDGGYFDEDGNHKTPSRTKKKKTRIPKNVVIDDDDDEDIPITKHITYHNEEKELINNILLETLKEETPEIKEKIRKAKNNWERLVDKLIQKRIDILRELVKKEKGEEDSDEEEDEKIEDIINEQNQKVDKKVRKTINISYNPMIVKKNYEIEFDKDKKEENNNKDKINV